MAVRLVVRHAKSALQGDTEEICFEFDQPRVVLGRGSGADVRLPGLAVSDTHATIEQQQSHYAVRDEGSTNGTQVNGVTLVPNRPRLLTDGDQLAIAEFVLTFAEGPLRRAPTAPERTATLARRMLRELLGSESAASELPFLRVIEGPDAGTLVNLGEPPCRLVIGRGDEADLVLTDVDISRAHVELVRDADSSILRDLDSKNGLEVNGKRMRERRLRHGDSVRLGATVIVYQDLAEQALRELERQPDLTLTRTLPLLSAALPGSESPAASEIAGDAVAIEPTPEPAPRAGPVDLLVYALATFVLVASLAGLFWLFG